MRRRFERYYYYKSFASELHFYKERMEDAGVSPSESYDIIFWILTDKYSSIREDYFYKFNISGKYKKSVIGLFPVTESPTLDTTIAYKSILETCIYLSKLINPSDKIYYSSIQLALSDDINGIIHSSFSQRVYEDFYRVNMSKLSSISYTKRCYRRLVFTPCNIVLINGGKDTTL